MPRLSRRALLAALAPTAGCVGTPGEPSPTPGTPTTDTSTFPPPPPTSAAPTDPTALPTHTDWPQFGRTPDRRGRLDGTAVPADPSLAWSFFSRMTPPVVADGTLYSVENNRKEALTARDAATGRQEWAVDLGGEAASVPAVGDGTVLVATDAGSLHGLSAAGESRWTADVGDGISTGPVATRSTSASGRGRRVAFRPPYPITAEDWSSRRQGV